MARKGSRAIALRLAAGVAFAVQFAALDVLMRGRAAYVAEPRLVVALLESAVIWAFVASVARSRAPRVVVASAASLLVVVDLLVFRFYHVPLDVQVVASAVHAWRDVGPVVWRALPSVFGSVLVVGAIEYALLAASASPRGAESSRWLWPVAICGLLSVPPRRATPDVRAVHALTGLRVLPAPPVAGAVPLPPLLSSRPELPSVLVVLSESVRASDYLPGGPEPTAPESALATPGRVNLAQMRSVSSYTAVSLSAILTGRSQEGGREAILRAPNLFDFARAVRDGRGRRPAVGYFSAQSETVFETKDVRAAVDRFVTLETLLGRTVEDEATIVELGMDRRVVRAFVDALADLPHPSVTVLHLAGTHAPYFVDPSRAPFQPYDHVVTWSRMPSLRNAYRNAIHAQDRSVAEALRAFAAHQAGRPYLVIFTSDHGEAFGEHGAIHHGQNLHDEQVHVPGWVFASPGALGSRAIEALGRHGGRFVTHLDLLPTVLDALDVWDNPEVSGRRAAMRGKSLLAESEASAAIPITNCTGMFPCPINTWGVLEGDRKLVSHLWSGAAWSCLALGGAEERPLPESDPGCVGLRAASRGFFPLMPNGAPNR